MFLNYFLQLMIFLHLYFFLKFIFFFSFFFFFLSKFSKLFLDLSSIDNGDTATGSGFRFPLVISTSIKLNDLTVVGKIINNVDKINLFFFITNLLTFLLHQNLTVILSIFHIQSLVLSKVDTI